MFVLVSNSMICCKNVHSPAVYAPRAVLGLGNLQSVVLSGAHILTGESIIVKQRHKAHAVLIFYSNLARGGDSLGMT